MRRLIFCFLFLAAVAGAQNYIPSPSTPRLMNEKGYISNSNPLPVTSVLASETIGLLDAVDAIKNTVEMQGLNASETAITAAIGEVKSALDGQGSNASETAITAAIGEVKEAIEGIDFSTTPIVSALNDVPSEIVTRKITLDANTNTSISSALSVPNRLYIEITTMKPEDEIWVNFGGAAVVGQTRRVSGGIGLKLVKSYQLGVIASTSLDIYVTEGGKNGD